MLTYVFFILGGISKCLQVLESTGSKISNVYKNVIIQYMEMILCEQLQRILLKFHSKYLSLIEIDMILYKIVIIRVLIFMCPKHLSDAYRHWETSDHAHCLSRRVFQAV